ncbi:MAG: single-stranded DNA-binding protein [Clostridia bacterium]
MNKITLIGNLTRDPELRTTPTGLSVCSFTIAVNRRFGQQNGEKITDFFRISAWRQLGENCAKYLAKGRKVAIIGELQARMYETNDGKTGMSLDVSADEVEFLSPRSEGSASSSEDTSARFVPQQHSSNQQPPSMDGFVDIDDDDLPF